MNLEFTFLDWAISGIIIISSVIGLFRGFVKEALSILFLVLAFWVGIRFYFIPAEYLKTYISIEAVRSILGFAILFFVTLIIGGIINGLISKLVEKTGLSGTDRTLGIVFGVSRGILLVALLLLVGEAINFSKSDAWSKSVFVPHFQPFVAWLKQFLPEDFNKKQKQEEQPKSEPVQSK